MNTDLNSLVEQTMSEYHEYEAEKKRKAEEQKREREQTSEQRLSQLVHASLTPEFLAVTSFSFRHDYDSYSKKLTTSAFFSYLGLNWHLSFEHGSPDWTISTVESDTPNKYRSQKASGVSSDVLQARLLIEMGKHREQVERLEREQAERTQERQRQQQERREMEARAEIALQERITEADREHERLLALFKEAWAKAERDMWRWPEGTTIELYQVEYAKGGYRDEDGATQIDYAGGWTAAYRLDTLGRIQLEPTRSYPSSVRMIQLVMDIHRPIWTVHQYSSVEELPETLRKKVTVSLPGVVERYFHGLDGKSRLVEVENLDYDEDEHEKTIGEVPLPWIRAIIESAANGE